MNILIPAAAPNASKPRYLSYDYKGEMFLKTLVSPYLSHNDVYVGVSQAHEDEWQASEFIKNEVPEAKIVILDKITEGPADTVYQMLGQAELDYEAPIFVHDADTLFTHATLEEDNIIYVSHVVNNDAIRNLSSKSFVECNREGIISDISESNIISGVFSVGGYSFERAEMFMDYFEQVQTNGRAEKWDVYLSHVINEAIMSGEQFTTRETQEYIDLSSDEDWKEYNDKPDIFCDVDGSIIMAQSRWGKNNYETGPVTVLTDNVERLLELQEKGSHIIFTSSRPQDTAQTTQDMLKTLGFRDFALICGLNNSRRVLINDYNNDNRFPRAVAVNLKRNSDNLRDFL